MKKILSFALLIVSCRAFAFDHSHKEWTALLSRNVKVSGSASTVDYPGFKKEAPAFNHYLHQLSDVKAEEFSAFTREQKMAFLINAYNAFTIKLIVNHYPLKSIKDIGSLFKSTWKIKFIQLLGQEISLDEIEHENLRKNFHEPRVHFAVNCASIGCPALRSEAYVAERLNAQLDEQAKMFLHDTSRNRLDLAAGKLELSMIFKWFHEDFERDGNSVQKFIAPFITEDPVVRAKLTAGVFTISYLDYNWNLNQHE